MKKNKVTTLPIQLEYNDKITLTRKLLDIYSSVWRKITLNSKSLLTICLLYDMNAKGFNSLVVESNIGFKNNSQVKTAMSRLVTDYKFIIVEGRYKKKSLVPELELIKQFINVEGEKAIKIVFKEKV